MELKNKKIVFLGDSITEGVGASCADNAYHQVLKRNAELAQAYNFGISGTRFAVQKMPSEPSSFDKDFCSRVKDLPEEVDAVVVFGGTNDYGHGDAPFGVFGDRTKDTFYGACSELMESLINKYPDKPLVFITPLHRTNEEYSELNGVPKNLTLADYVDAIREVAEYYSIPVLDMFAAGGMQPNIQKQNELYFADGLHPNDTGHAFIADKLEKFLKNI